MILENLSFDKALEFLKIGELPTGYNISILTVVEPIDFDLAKPKIFNDNFSFIFNSNNENIHNAVVEDIINWLERNTQPRFFHVDLDKLKMNLLELAETKTKNASKSDNAMMITRLLHHYLLLVLINSNGKKLWAIPFVFNTKKFGDVFWIYVGTRKLTEKEIVLSFDDKLDFLKLQNIVTRKSFVIMLTRD